MPYRELSARDQIAHFADQDMLLGVLEDRGIVKPCVACRHQCDCNSTTDQRGRCEFYDLDLSDPVGTELRIEEALLGPRQLVPEFAVAA